jgi:hypothetical protein
VPDKERERFYLAALRACGVSLPNGDPLEPDPPDFLLDPTGKRLGIEMTVFYYPPVPGKPPQQEVQSLRDRIMALAERSYSGSGGPALYVNAVFNDQFRLRKAEMSRVADALVTAISAIDVPPSIEDGRRTVPVYLLPREIPHVSILGSVDGIDRLWQAGSGGWVAPITPEHVQREVERKASIIRNVGGCAELWLVIVHDPFSGAAAAELTTAAQYHVYSTQFDRLLWLEPHAPRAIELRHRRA